MSKASKAAGAFSLIASVIVALLIAFALKTFVVQPYVIPSGSMESTISIGDKVLVNKLAYQLRDPHPGDIVVFHNSAAWKESDGGGENENVLIKRVIATAGQSIRCCDVSGRMEIKAVGSNTWVPLDDSQFVYQDYELDQRVFTQLTIPAGRIFVMGDHRSRSADSLYHYRTDGKNITEATVPVSSVIGKAVVTVWPLNRLTALGTPSTFQGHGLATGGKSTSFTTLMTYSLMALIGLLVVLFLARMVSGGRQPKKPTNPRPGKPKKLKKGEVPPDLTIGTPLEIHKDTDPADSRY